ncbi:hypothetical protein BH09ACT8_BH09ACT8_09830 [soil metagenome]
MVLQRDAASLDGRIAAESDALACVTDVRDADQVDAALARTIEGVRAAPGYAAYAAAKAGVINFTKTAALELAPHGIRVNGLAPDLTITEGILSMSPTGWEAGAKQMTPMGRAGDVDEMTGAAVFLASALSSYVTGQTLHVDGGTAASAGWYHHPDDGHYVLGVTT